jgi:FkbM family methyltransferase
MTTHSWRSLFSRFKVFEEPSREVEARRSSLEDVRAELRVLRAIVMHEKQIDLVKIDRFMNFMLRDDSAYESLPPDTKQKSLSDLETHRIAVEKIDSSKFVESWKCGDDVLKLMVAAFACKHPESHFIDVGAQYGTLTMTIATFVRSLGKQVEIFAFECGVTRHLAGANFRNNGFPEIRYYPSAVGPVDGYVTVHRDLFHSEGNRIGAAMSSWERGSTDDLVKCVRLDRLFDEGVLGKPCVLKIDTEGAEPAVIRGANRYIKQTPCALMMEFTPSGFGATIGERSPANFLTDLSDKFHVFDAGVHHVKARYIRPHEFEALSLEVAASAERWTDLVLLDRRSEACELILKKMLGNG